MLSFPVNHVAFVVASLEMASQPFRNLGASVGDFHQSTTGETLQSSVGSETNSGVLLIEPIGTGLFRQALSESGPGLHHISLCFSGVEALAEAVDGTGWFLHVETLKTLPKAAWLCRPGVPFLIEAEFSNDRQSLDLLGERPFVDRVEVPFASEHLNAVGSLLGGFVIRSSTNDSRIFVGGRSVSVSRLVSGTPF